MNLKLVAIIVVILALAGGVIYVQRTTRNDTLRDVKESQDKAVNDGVNSRANFDTCPDGMWDYSANRCKSGPRANR